MEWAFGDWDKLMSASVGAVGWKAALVWLGIACLAVANGVLREKPLYVLGDVKLDRAYIGSCTGGKITDMIFAANILHGNSVKIPTFVVPGSRPKNVYGKSPP